jgi:hypothetical protein
MIHRRERGERGERRENFKWKNVKRGFFTHQVQNIHASDHENTYWDWVLD